MSSVLPVSERSRGKHHLESLFIRWSGCFYDTLALNLCLPPAVSILDAARNSLSFFLLLIVSLGLGVVREELEVMPKARLLAILHAIFGGLCSICPLQSLTNHFSVLYAVGMDLIELETVSGMLLLFFVIPLAVTMTTFLLWIMYGLTGRASR